MYNIKIIKITVTLGTYGGVGDVRDHVSRCSGPNKQCRTPGEEFKLLKLEKSATPHRNCRNYKGWLSITESEQIIITNSNNTDQGNFMIN